MGKKKYAIDLAVLKASGYQTFAVLANSKKEAFDLLTNRVHDPDVVVDLVTEEIEVAALDDDAASIKDVYELEE